MVRFLLFRIGESHKWYSLQARILLTIIIDGSELSQRISKFSGSKLGVVHELILPPSTINPHKLMDFLNINESRIEDCEAVGGWEKSNPYLAQL